MDLKKRLQNCSGYEIDLRLHVLHFRLVSEQINEADVIENIDRLKNLDLTKLFKFESIDKHKFKLYFKHSKSIFHKYVIDIRDNERKIRVVTVHRIHGKLQKEFDKYVFK